VDVHVERDLGDILARISVDGNFDPSLPDGPTVLAIDPSMSTADTTYSPQAVSVLGNGQIVVVGCTQSKSSGAYRALVASFAPSGVRQGFATARSGELLRAIQVDGSGRVVVGGSSVVSGPTQSLHGRWHGRVLTRHLLRQQRRAHHQVRHGVR
jgi:hypothetical protein